MKIRLEQLRRTAVDLIKHPSLDDVNALARLAPIPAKLQHLGGQLQDIEDEVSRIEKLLLSFSHTHEQPSPGNARHQDPEALNSPNGRRQQQKIHIEIDLSQLGLSGGKKIISEHKASDSLISFLAFLYEIKGVTILERLSQFSVNRGSLVSKSPRTDYRYQSSTGEAEYNNQPISNSGFFALTASATKEKVAAIRNAWKFLNLPSGALKVEEADKYETVS